MRVRIRIPRQFGEVDSVRVRSNPDHEPYFAVATAFQRVHGWTWWEAEVTVENPVHGYRFLINSADGSLTWVNALGVSSTETLDADDFKLIAYPAPPDWGRSSVMYQIFPDRFARSKAADDRALPDWALPAKWGDEPIHIGPDTPRQFFGGDLAGRRGPPRPPRAARRHDDLPDARSSRRARTTGTTRCRSPRSIRCSAVTRRSRSSCGWRTSAAST